MLTTNYAMRAILAEVLSHPWMVFGFNGSPDPHMLHREPLRTGELDQQVIRGMTGFEFGSEQDIEKQLVTILESEEYVRTVQHWEKKHNIGGHLNGHGKEVSPSEDLFSLPLDGIIPFASNTSSRGDPSTPSEMTERVAGFDFDRRKLPSMSTKPVSPMVHSPSHPSLNEPNHEPLDPTSGYHPLLSIYYLTREKLEQKRVYGPGPFPSSQLSIQDPSHAASPASSSGGPGGDRSSSTSGVNIHINRSSPKRERESLPPPQAGSKADHSRGLPRLPMSETLLHSGRSYDNMNANSRASDLSWQERDQTEAKKEKDARGKEELWRNEEEAQRKAQEAKQKEQEVRRKEEEVKEQEEELRKKDEDVRKHEEDVTKREEDMRRCKEDVRRREEDVRRREEDVTKHEEDVTRREEDVTRCEGDVTKCEDDVWKREEDVRKREEDVRKCEEDVRQCEEDVKKRAEETQQKERCARLFVILRVPESFKKLVCLQEHQAQEMMDLLQKVRLPFWTHIMFII